MSAPAPFTPLKFVFAAWLTCVALAIYCCVGAALNLNVAWLWFALWLIGSGWLSAVTVWFLGRPKRRAAFR